jgi:hypothetical protein
LLKVAVQVTGSGDWQVSCSIRFRANDTRSNRHETVEPTAHWGFMAASQSRRHSLAGLITKRFGRILAFVVILSSVFSGFAAHTVNLAWDASPDATVAGYKIYFGTDQASLTTGSAMDVGTNLTASIPNLGGGTYYFGAVSYNASRAESDLSNIASTNLLDAPVIVSQSPSVTCNYGANTNLRVTATGSTPLTYQWFSNGVAMVDGGNVSGSATSTLSFTSAVFENQASYQVVVSNNLGTATSSVMTLTVINPPSIASQPVSLTRNVGASATFSVTANGAPPLNYRWFKSGATVVDGGGVSGAATASLTIASVASGNAGSYVCVVTNSSGNVTSGVALLTVVVPPSITSQPVSQTVGGGSNVIFSVSASGTAPLTYAWSKNGSALANGGKISGATTAALTVTGATTAEAGGYSVVVSNAGGTATSEVAVLDVLAPPTITAQPSSVTTNIGASAVFSITAQGGSSTLGYQWLKSGVAVVDGGTITGSTTASLTLANVTNSDAGPYQCVVTNSSGGVTSSVATLSVIVAPTIATQPASQTVNNNTAAIFNVSATGTAPFTYAWYKNGGALANSAKISGATTASLTVTNTATTDAGSYTVVVSNAAGSVTSSVALLTVISPPVITLQPVPATTNAGSQATFSVVVQGSQPMSYQWTLLSNPITDSAKYSGTTSATLTIANVSSSDGTSYRCIITNAAGSATSSMVPLAVIVPPSITAQPGMQTVNYGANAVFNVGVSGTAPMTYVWSKNGTPLANGGNIAGASSASLTVGNVTFADAGSFSCVISNSAGTATSANGVMSVVDNTVILTQPASQTLNSCDTLQLSVSVGGSTTPTYQWLHNGAIVPGATGATLSVAGITAADAGTYAVQVTGNSMTTSSNAIVTVADPVLIAQPADNCVAANATNIFSVQACGTASFSYQWFFTAAGTTKTTALASATNSDLAIGPATSQNAGQYFCVVTNVNGSVTSRAASLGVEAAPTITSQPANLNKTTGTSATFTVGATANAPLTFQWSKDGSDIAGASSSVYTIASVQLSDAGTYRCVVGTTLCQSTAITATTYGHLAVKADRTKPSVKFSSPTINTRFTNATVTRFGAITSTVPQIVISGTATDDSRVANVVITRTFPTTAPLKIVPNLVGTSTSMRWTNAVTLVAGTNSFAAVVTDGSGLTATNVLDVFLRVPVVFHLSTNGLGTITPKAPLNFGTPTNGAVLEIGRNYIIQAKANPGMMFSNWVNGAGVEVSTSPLLVFRMQTDLQLTANFVTNPIIANNANGSYNGLFYEADQVRIKSAGALFNVQVRTDATFSATLKVDGVSYPLTGTFDIHGNVTKSVLRKGKTTLTVALHLDWITKQLSGKVSSPAPDAWTSAVTGDFAPFTASNPYPNPARDTLAINPDMASAASPGGFGFGFVTVSSAGVISLTGTLADGTTISQTAPISGQGYWPVYIPLNGNRGLLEGWLNFSSGAPRGNVSWIRPAGSLTANYTGGFTNETTVMGSQFTPQSPSLSGALDIGSLSWQYALNNNNAIVALPGGATNALSGSISATTGAVSVSYRATGATANQTARGALLQWNNAAYGFVLSNNVSIPLQLH